MEAYRDIDRDSGIIGFEVGDNYIRVQFRDGGVYRWTAASAGAFNIASMKRLAVAGDGLNSFINLYVRHKYALKER